MCVPVTLGTDEYLPPSNYLLEVKKETLKSAMTKQETNQFTAATSCAINKTSGNMA
jgi:hypothetical protein